MDEPRTDGRIFASSLLILLAVVVLLGFLSSCSPGDQNGRPSEALAAEDCGVRFEEIAAAAGIDFRHFAAIRAALLPEDNGSGLAFGDYDNDGWDDLYVANLAGPVLMSRDELHHTRQPGRLFHNRGDGTFLDVTERSGLEHIGWDNAAIWVDVDGDGWLDLVIAGIEEVALFGNLGVGADGGVTFEDRSSEAGLGEMDCLAAGPAAADFDGDGDLDLYVPCYVDFPWHRARDRPLVGGRPATMTTPADYPPQHNRLFENDGSGRFYDVAEAAGVVDAEGRGLQAVFVDLDDDGRPDLYVANDQSFDRLYHNQGDGTFLDVAASAGTRDPRAAMGVAIGDYDLDGGLDVFVTHWVGEENALYANLSIAGSLVFEDRTLGAALAPADPSWVGWGTGLVDFDLDGDLDVLLVNGSTVEDEWTLEVLSEPKMIPQPMVLYEQESKTFRDRSACAGAAFTEPIVGRGASFADFDRDGLVDAAVSVHNGSPLLLHNVSERLGHWIGVQLSQPGPNPFAVGAKVTLESAGRTYVGQLLAGESYAGSNSLTLHFGIEALGIEALGTEALGTEALGTEALGTEGEVVGSIEVRWPDGELTKTGPLAADRLWRLTRGREDASPVPRRRLPPRPWQGL